MRYWEERCYWWESRVETLKTERCGDFDRIDEDLEDLKTMREALLVEDVYWAGRFAEIYDELLSYRRKIAAKILSKSEERQRLEQRASDDKSGLRKSEGEEYALRKRRLRYFHLKIALPVLAVAALAAVALVVGRELGLSVVSVVGVFSLCLSGVALAVDAVFFALRRAGLRNAIGAQERRSEVREQPKEERGADRITEFR